MKRLDVISFPTLLFMDDYGDIAKGAPFGSSMICHKNNDDFLGYTEDFVFIMNKERYFGRGNPVLINFGSFDKCTVEWEIHYLRKEPDAQTL